MNRLQEWAQTAALTWLEGYLSDKHDLEDLWGNYIEAAYEEPPITREEFDILVPKVLEALKSSQPLPEMDFDTKAAFTNYLEGFEDTIRTAEHENKKEYGPTEDWTDAVLEAYRSLYQTLRS